MIYVVLTGLYIIVYCCSPLVFGQCAFPCSRQTRTYTLGNTGSDAVYGTPEDITLLQISNNNSVFLKLYCVSRSEAFYVLRMNNGTHDLYRCNKDVTFQQPRRVIVLYANPWKYYGYIPSICEVCEGTDMTSEVYHDVELECGVVVTPDIGCNIPSICPVTKAGQIKCSPCDNSDGDDDGLGCTC